MKPNELLRSLSWSEKKSLVQTVGALAEIFPPMPEESSCFELGTLLEKMMDLEFDNDDLLRWDSTALWLITNVGYARIAIKVG